MRQSQQKNRMRGRGRKGPSPLSRTFESNGPDVKIRGTASHIAEKYASLARDALSAGDNVMGENYLQHAEHYNRIVAAAAAAQSSRAEEGANASYGRGPQPDVNGYNGGGEAGENQQHGGRHQASDRDDDSEQDEFSGEETEKTARGDGEGEEQRPRSESRGRRRQRHDRGDRADRSGNGNGHDAEPANGEARQPKREGMSSDASMLPDSIVGKGADTPTETGAED